MISECLVVLFADGSLPSLDGHLLGSDGKIARRYVITRFQGHSRLGHQSFSVLQLFGSKMASPGLMRGRNRLPSVAHFLYRWSRGAGSKQPCQKKKQKAKKMTTVNIKRFQYTRPKNTAWGYDSGKLSLCI